MLSKLNSSDLYQKMDYCEDCNIIVNRLYEVVQQLNREMLMTFQESIEFCYSNPRGLKSYEWLKERIGYYPVWTMKVKKGISKEDFSTLVKASMCWKRQYVFFINPAGLETIDTYIYAWCDVHSIENFGCEEPGDFEVKEKYTRDWKSHILMDNYEGELEVQTLVKEVLENNIIKIIDKGNSRETKTNRMSLF